MNFEFLLGVQMTLLSCESARKIVPSSPGRQRSEANF